MNAANDGRRGLVSHWTFILALAGALLGAAAGLVLAGAPRLARVELERQVRDLARLTGFEIRIGSVSIDLRGALVLKDVAAADRRGAGLRLRAERLRTRMHAGAFLRGLERQVDIDVDGLRVEVPRGEPGSGLRLLRRAGRLARSAAFAGDWRVAVEGGRIAGDDWTVDSVRLLVGRSVRGQPATGQVVCSVVTEEGTTALSATLDLDGGPAEQLTVAFDGELPVGPVPGLRARGFSVRGDTLQLDGARGELHGGVLRGVARAVVLRSRAGLAPVVLQDVAAAAIHGLDADLEAGGLQLLAEAELPRAMERLDLIGGELRASVAGGRLTLRRLDLALVRAGGVAVRGQADAEAAGLVLDAGWAAPTPVMLPTASGHLSVAWPGEDGARRLGVSELTVGGLPLEAAVEPGSRGVHVTVRAPDQPCAQLAEALPGALLPGVRPGQRAAGRFGGTLELDGPDDGWTWRADGRFACTPGPLDTEREQALAAVAREAERRAAGDELSEPARRWAVPLLLGRSDASTLVRAPTPADLEPPSASRPSWGPLERLAAQALPPPDGTLAWRLGLAVAAMRLGALLDPAQVAERLALELPIGDARGIAAAAGAVLGKEPGALSPVDVAFLVAVAQQGGEAPTRGPLDEVLRKRVAANMRELMLNGAISPEEFVTAAPYDPLTAGPAR